MTTTAERTLPPLTDRTRLDQAIARLDSDDATLTDVSTVLHLAARMDLPAERHEALEELACRALGRFDTFTRWAPAAGLKDMVADYKTTCARPDGTCSEVILPWIYDGTHCGPDCRNAAARAFGDE